MNVNLKNFCARTSCYSADGEYGEHGMRSLDGYLSDLLTVNLSCDGNCEKCDDDEGRR